MDVRDDVTIWDHYGDVCYRLGDAATAREAWTKALKNAEAESKLYQDGRLQEIQRKLKVLK
jgi:predicted negative regulator of RcsB-dependent stress response